MQCRLFSAGSVSVFIYGETSFVCHIAVKLGYDFKGSVHAQNSNTCIKNSLLYGSVCGVGRSTYSTVANRYGVELECDDRSCERREANGDQYIANLQHGSWCGFKYFAFDGTESKLIVTVRGSAAGTLKVYTDCNLPPVASVPVKPSDDWTEYSEKLEITAGEAPLYFVYEGGGSLDFSVFEIE